MLAYAAAGDLNTATRVGHFQNGQLLLSRSRGTMAAAGFSTVPRLLGRTARLLHLVSYLVNHSRGEVAGSMEALEGYVDHGTRRLAPFPDAAAAKLDTLVARDAALPWSPELSGSIRLVPGQP